MQKHIKYKTGFTIAELLVALAISSILLVAVAVAFQSSMMNYRENEDIFKVINNARQALFRITTQLRTANAVMISEPNNMCTFQTPDSESITYEYRSAENKLYLITNDDGNEYVLCDDVTAMTFTRETFYDSDEDLTKVKSVQISMTVVNGNTEKTISAAAVVRRNLN